MAGVAILIGPEGGFTESEVAQAEASGYTPATIAPATLPTELAAPVAVAQIVLLSSGGGPFQPPYVQPPDIAGPRGGLPP